MLAIIAVHSICAWGLHTKLGLTRDLQIAFLQALKFGTIGFYLISGFLLGERLPRYSASEYLVRRWKAVGGPWAVWTSIFGGMILVRLATTHGATAQELCRRAFSILLYSPYWFVPNFLFGLAILLVFRRFLDDLRFGAILAGASLFYGVNVYTKWIPGNHTVAVFGFVFYLWLGNWASRNFQRIRSALEQVPVRGILLAIGVLGAIALGEAYYLGESLSGNADPEAALNTLRVSNQLFSIVVVLGFVKCGQRLSPSVIDVRATTFGQYLIHPVCILLLHRAFDLGIARITSGGVETANANPIWDHPAPAIGIWLAMFVGGYGISLAVAKWVVAQPRLAWMVGQGRIAKRTHRTPEVIVTLASPEISQIAA